MKSHLSAHCMVLVLMACCLSCETGTVKKPVSARPVTKPAAKPAETKPTTTPDPDALPQVRTVELVGRGDVQFLDGTSAVLSGLITYKGQSPVTEAGICWSTRPEPTVADGNLRADANDAWALTATGLAENTRYHVRAYAINAAGTAYGNEITFNSGRRFGSDHAGGQVFYNDGTGGGLVLSRTEIGYCEWITGTAQNTRNGKTSYDIGKGADNTDAIIAQTGHSASAAQRCRSAKLEGFSDWFLPSYREAVLIGSNLYIPKRADLRGASLWTSTEADAAWAWFIDFGPSKGQFGKALKKSSITVRPVRRFAP